MPLESVVQKNMVIKEVHKYFPNAIVLKIDPTNMLSFPDLLVLVGNKWAALETKRYHNSSQRPNQGYYVGLLNEMSFSAFIHSGNYKEVVHDMARSFAS